MCGKERHVMKPVIRSLIASLGTFAAFYYVYWVPVAIILEVAYGRFQWSWIIRGLGSLVAAAGVAQYTWRHKAWAPQGLVTCVILPAVVTSTRKPFWLLVCRSLEGLAELRGVVEVLRYATP